MARRSESDNGRHGESPMGITALNVRGFKSLASATRVDIRGLTILAGPNSSGKSSVMQPLLMLKQTLEAAYDPGPLLLDGPNVRFTKAQQMFARQGIKRHADSCEFGIESDDRLTIANKYALDARHGLQLVETRRTWPNKEQVLHESMTDVDIRRALPELIPDGARRLPSLHGWTLRVHRNRCFLGLEDAFDGITWVSRLYTDTDNQIRHIQEVIHLPGLRGNPERTYRMTATSDAFPGLFHHYGASVIHHWQSSNDERLGQIGADLQV